MFSLNYYYYYYYCKSRNDHDPVINLSFFFLPYGRWDVTFGPPAILLLLLLYFLFTKTAKLSASLFPSQSNTSLLLLL